MRTMDHGSGRATRAAALAVLTPALTLAMAAPAVAAPTGDTGTIRGFVWNDLNHDGIQDAGEPGAANVSVGYQAIIDGQPGLVYMKVTTGADGAYSIDEVPAGEYRLFANTEYWLFTTASAGDDRSKDSDFVGYTDNPGRAVQQWASTESLTVGADATVVLDAGVVQRPGGSGTISGRAWDDRNGNGIQNPGEPGVAVVEIGCQHVIGGVQIGNLLGRVPTSADGTYVIENVPAGRYKVFATTSDRDFTVASAGNRPRKDSDFQGGGILGSARQGVTRTLTVHDGRTLVLDAGLIPRAS